MTRALLALTALFVGVSMAHASKTTQLPPFGNIEVCTPLTVAIVPSKGDAYTLTVDGDKAVLPAVVPSVSQDTLYLGSQGDFSSTSPIKVTVSLPAAKLASVTVGGSGNTVVDAGFSVPSLAVVASGSGSLLLRNLKAGSLNFDAGGSGSVTFSGTATSASLRATGSGTVYVSGVTGQVAVQGSGSGEILISSPSDALQITGDVSGSGSLTYNKGTCSVTSTGSGEACDQGDVTPPDEDMAWTCGVQHSGVFNCNGSTNPGQTSSLQCSAGPNALSVSRK